MSHSVSLVLPTLIDNEPHGAVWRGGWSSGGVGASEGAVVAKLFCFDQRKQRKTLRPLIFVEVETRKFGSQTSGFYQQFSTFLKTLQESDKKTENLNDLGSFIRLSRRHHETPTSIRPSTRTERTQLIIRTHRFLSVWGGRADSMLWNIDGVGLPHGVVPGHAVLIGRPSPSVCLCVSLIRNIGTSEHWNIGTLEHLHTGRDEDALMKPTDGSCPPSSGSPVCHFWVCCVVVALGVDRCVFLFLLTLLLLLLAVFLLIV